MSHLRLSRIILPRKYWISFDPRSQAWPGVALGVIAIKDKYSNVVLKVSKYCLANNDTFVYRSF